MTKKWIGINLLLFVIAALAAWQLKESVQQQEKNITIRWSSLLFLKRIFFRNPGRMKVPGTARL
jgi:hypothetical protein